MDKGRRGGRGWGIRITAILACAISVALADVARAGSDAAGFYKGKVVRFVVGYGPGGGYDGYARLLAPWLERAIGATVVVENRPGGGSLTALNQVVAAAPDGLTIMLVNGEAAALAQLLEQPGVRFDLRVLPWLGRVSAEPYVVLWHSALPFKRLDEIAGGRQRIRWAASGKADGMGDNAALFSEALGLDARIIIGYKGSNEAASAAMRGESDGVIVTVGSARKYTQGGDLVPIAILDRQRSPQFAHVPTIFEAVPLAPAQRWWVEYRMGLTALGRSLATTPGTPHGRLKHLRNAFRKILAEPEVRSQSETAGRSIDYASPDQVTGFVAGTLGTMSPDRLTALRRVVLDQYY